MKVVHLAVLLSILAVLPGILVAYGDSYVLSPRAQMASGIIAEDVACRDDLQLMIRNNGDAVCVSETTSQRLAETGFAVISGSSDGGAMYDLMKQAVLSVTNALALYDDHGEDAFEMITALNIEGNMYPFVITSDDAIEIADGSTLDRRGIKIWSNIELEAAVGNFRDMLDAGNGAWITYVFLNPPTNMDQAKMTWIMQRDGYIFGSGFYIEGQDAKLIEADWSVRKAISTYIHLGTDETFRTITAMESTNESYPFVLDGDGIVLAHGAIPMHVGDQSTLLMLDEWENILAKLDDTGKITVEYEFTNPATGNVEPKRAVLVLHDGHIFGSGFYNPQ